MEFGHKSTNLNPGAARTIMLLKFSSDVLLTTSRNEGTKKLLDRFLSKKNLKSFVSSLPLFVDVNWRPSRPRSLAEHVWPSLDPITASSPSILGCLPITDYSKIHKIADKAVLSSSGFQADVKALQKVLNSRHLVYQHQHNKQMSHQDLQEH
ncbi:hypothetical protein HID58_059860 [Brassica napus]|uniref:Uncharacterized protein n=2 Tax=Brassica TaxID=3705 RepID=A0ABQ7ZU26_BRANA|nr:hypothetical protein HID58_059860 [Brassica napus]